jgi:hypothetical protein
MTVMKTIKGFSFAIAIILVSFAVSGLAQQNSTYKVKSSPSEKAPKKAAPISTKTAGTTTASAANAKSLQSVEHENAKAAKPAGSGKKTGTTLKPVKDKPNPPINFNGGSGKTPAGTHAVPDPSKGRLKEKHSGHQ